ncbi:endothelial cell-specific chemotaxis regulator isoform X3 [Sceloporus undulatus]|uniref:endothelial cell-specific chemotaxis regulator isoform X3 n=1 Tax=Sceloporus undulatus TaxID=8520 RepID=UPI001C4C62DB|nr:endothelial cell-specific chemotaxis regulator isoform X3 [Sceloporus undulatus]
MTALKILVLLWICHCVFLQGSEFMKNESIALPSLTVSTGTAKLVTLVVGFQDANILSSPSPTEEKSAALSVAASADKQKPQHPVVTYSCSDAETTAGMKNVLLVSMKDLNTSNKDVTKTMVTYEE